MYGSLFLQFRIDYTIQLYQNVVRIEYNEYSYVNDRTRKMKLQCKPRGSIPQAPHFPQGINTVGNKGFDFSPKGAKLVYRCMYTNCPLYYLVSNFRLLLSISPSYPFFTLHRYLLSSRSWGRKTLVFNACVVEMNIFKIGVEKNSGLFTLWRNVRRVHNAIQFLTLHTFM